MKVNQPFAGVFLWIKSEKISPLGGCYFYSDECDSSLYNIFFLLESLRVIHLFIFRVYKTNLTSIWNKYSNMQTIEDTKILTNTLSIIHQQKTLHLAKEKNICIFPMIAPPPLHPPVATLLYLPLVYINTQNILANHHYILHWKTHWPFPFSIIFNYEHKFCFLISLELHLDASKTSHASIPINTKNSKCNPSNTLHNSKDFKAFHSFI